MAARLVGINHVALEVGSIEEALAWYRRFFTFELRGRGDRMAFVDMGDQFLAFAEAPATHRDVERHFGLVVDDKTTLRRTLEEAGVELAPAPNLTFRDPWGNAVQVVDYREIQFTKTDRILRGMRLPPLAKTERAISELRAKGLSD